jgi:hypothetical protein
LRTPVPAPASVASEGTGQADEHATDDRAHRVGAAS